MSPSRIDYLLGSYLHALAMPPAPTQELNPFIIVYEDQAMRHIERRWKDFKQASGMVRLDWVEIDVAGIYDGFINSKHYHELYLKDADTQSVKAAATSHLKKVLDQNISDAGLKDTMFALTNVEALFGRARLSDCLADIRSNPSVHVTAFYPGTYQDGRYRLLGRDEERFARSTPIVLEPLSKG